MIWEGRILVPRVSVRYSTVGAYRTTALDPATREPPAGLLLPLLYCLSGRELILNNHETPKPKRVQALNPGLR
jgi:hypothetical protein